MHKAMISSLFIMSCAIFTACQNDKSKIQHFIESIDYANTNLNDVKFVIVIPEAGCSGCISYMEDFYLRNSTKKSLFFIFSNIVSQKMLKCKLDLNESNTFLDIDNKIMDCYPLDKKIYPCVLELEEGIVKNIYYQSPEENALSIIEQKLNIQ